MMHREAAFHSSNLSFPLGSRGILLGFLFLASFLIFSQHLSLHSIEYRDDEIFYYESAKEMMQAGNILSPTYFGENRFQKPILFYWFILLSYKIFGTGWFAARVTSAIFAAFTVCLTWLIGERLFDKKAATLASLILMTIPLFFRHAKNAVPDMALNFFIVLAFYCLLRFAGEGGKYRYGFFAACALGFMVKGFTALVIPIVSLVIYFLLTRKGRLLKEINFPAGLLILAAIILPWFLYMMSVHGDMYTNYVLKTETLDRVLPDNNWNILVRTLANLVNNFPFYCRNLFSYFAPWSLFAALVIPFAVIRVIRLKENREALLFLLVWFLSGFLFFSFLATRINHLILVLTTPFALLLSYFFLKLGQNGAAKGNSFHRFIKIIIIALVFLGFLGLSFLKVFLAGESALWMAACAAAFLALSRLAYRHSEAAVAPAVLALLIFFVYAQIPFLSKIGLVPFAVHKEFAQAVNREVGAEDIIAVGSHDIHKKELQLYFDRPLEEVGNDNDDFNRWSLGNLFSQEKTVYCVMTEKDFLLYRSLLPPQLSILREDFIARKRIYPDRALFSALFRFDRPAVKSYFFEKVILIKKNKDA